jgi:hypothetical protein
MSVGSYIAMPAGLVSTCPSAFANRLTSTAYRKQIYELTGIPSVPRFNIDICLQPNGRWDSIQTLLRCNVALTSCTCSTNDDGCGAGAGGTLTRVPYSAGYRYFVIAYPYSASIVNTYRVRFAAA